MIAIFDKTQIASSSKGSFLLKRFFVLIAFLLAAQSVHAAEVAESGPVRKLQRGFLNIALCPMEFTNILAYEKYENDDQMLPSWVTGSVKGVAFTAGRALSGLYDIVTFPFPIPKEYGSLVTPELPWDSLKTSPTVQSK